MEFWAKVMKLSDKKIVAICDADLLGKTFKERSLTLKVSPEFYGGQRVEVYEALNLLREASVINLIGENIVRKAVEENIIHEDGVLKVAGVPHAQLIK